MCVVRRKMNKFAYVLLSIANMRKTELKLFLNIARKDKEKGYIEQNIKN